MNRKFENLWIVELLGRRQTIRGREIKLIIMQFGTTQRDAKYLNNGANDENSRKICSL